MHMFCEQAQNSHWGVLSVHHAQGLCTQKIGGGKH